MSTLKLDESTSTLKIFPGTSTLGNEIQKNVQIRDFRLPAYASPRAFSKALGLGNASKVLSLVFELLTNQMHAKVIFSIKRFGSAIVTCSCLTAVIIAILIDILLLHTSKISLSRNLSICQDIQPREYIN